MISLTTLAIASAIVALLYLYFKEEDHGGKRLPGPRGLPILGSIFSLSITPHIRFGEWIKYYGNVFMVKVANYRVVVINDEKIAREAYNNPALNGKPDFLLFNIVSEGKYGIFSTQGHAWVEQRRFTLRHLRDFGFGKTAIQSLVMEEVNEFVDWLKSLEGQSLSPNRKFSLATINSLWQIMTGKRFKQTDPELTNMLETSNKVFAEASLNPILLFFPGLAESFPKLTGYAKVKTLIQPFLDLTLKPILEHKAEFSVDNPPRDFIDSYLQEIEKTTDPQSTFYKDQGDKQLENMIGDLFGAGSETTASTLSWAILYLTKNPATLKKMQAEIDSVVGLTRAVVLDDRKNMPYSEAVILETLRKSSITPVGVIHAALETTTLQGYTIPKGTWILVNQHFIHHDPKIWGDPENFRPERWLSSDGKTTVKNDALVAFSVGKRNCIGEQIARDSAFLFLTNIVQKFNIEFDKNLPEPSTEPIPGFFLAAKPYNVIMKDRTG